jgi:hypothetical protein
MRAELVEARLGCTPSTGSGRMLSASEAAMTTICADNSADRLAILRDLGNTVRHAVSGGDYLLAR